MPEAALASSHFEPDGYGDARKFLINYYVEPNGGDPQRQTRLVNTPGSRLIDKGTVLTTGVRGLFQADGFAGGDIVVADGTTIRLYDVSSATWSALTGTMAGTDRVKAVFGEVQAGFLSGGSLFQSGGASVAALSDADWATLLSDAGETAYTSIATMGQRLLASYGSRFAFSATLQFNDTTTLSYYTAEYAPDGIVGLMVLNNTLLIFGTSTIQPWVETGDNDDPFSPIVGQEIDRGCMARDTIVKMDNGIAFIGDDRVPYIMRGLSLQRLNQNDPWVTRVLKATDAADVVCSVIEDDGHSFYVIHTPTKCMVHDLATGTWHLRQSVDYRARQDSGVVAATLGAITLVATGTLMIEGELAATLGAITLEATGEDTTSFATEGAVDATLGAVTLAATGELSTVYDADAQALFDEFTTDPGDTRKGVINDFIEQLKADGIWSKIDALWVPRAHDSQAAGLNWKSPTTFTLTAVSSPTFTADRGYAGDGSSSYLTTGFIPSTHGVQLTLNSASLGVYVSAGDTTADNNAILLGTTNLRITPRRTTSDIFRGNINSTGLSDFATQTTRLGLWAVNRSASGAVQGYRNGASQGSDTDASTALDTTQLFICSWNNAGSRAGTANNQIGLAWVGGSLTSGEHAAFDAALDTYIAATP